MCHPARPLCLTRADEALKERRHLPLDEFDRPEGFVHVTDGQVEAEVQHGVTGGLLTVLQAHKVPEGSSGHHVGDVGGLVHWCRCDWDIR